jgi:hypothetical protein
MRAVCLFGMSEHHLHREGQAGRVMKQRERPSEGGQKPGWKGKRRMLQNIRGCRYVQAMVVVEVSVATAEDRCHKWGRDTFCR